MTSYIDVTNLSDTITAVSTLAAPITILIVAFVGVIIVLAVIGFVVGMFDTILDGMRRAFKVM